MNKQELLSLLAISLKDGTVTPTEVMSVVKVPEAESKTTLSATAILYTIGGIIMLIGVGTLLFRFWSDLASPVRILLTLGIGLAAYITAAIIRSDKTTTGLVMIMETLSGVLIPVGAFVLVHEMGVLDLTIGWNTSVLLILAMFFIFSFVLFRSVIFSLFSIIFTTATLYAFIGYMLSNTPSVDMGNAYKYLTLAVGVSFLLLASYVKTTSSKALTGFLNTFGIGGILGALLVLGDFKPNQNVVWELIGIVALLGGLYLARKVQSSAILRTTAFFIFIYIGKFTAEYFADSMGWPIALMFGGIVLIAVGYGLVVFNKRSINKLEVK